MKSPSVSLARFSSALAGLARGRLRNGAPAAIVLAAALAFAPLAFAQVAAPAAVGAPLYTGFQIPKVSGTVQFSASASDQVTYGYNGANATNNSITLSGNAAYLSSSIVYPFRLIYSGGLLGDTVGQPTTFFQNLSLSQGLNTAHWRFLVADSVQYVPDTPSVGLSGIAGVGDLGISTGIDQQQAALTPYATRVDNSANASASRSLTGSTSLQFSGNYTIERFLNALDAIQTDTYGVSAGVSHRIDARTSISANYAYTDFSYVGVDGAFTTQGVTVNVSRSLTRQLSVTLGAGPQYIGASALDGTPGRLNYTVDARIGYTGNVRSGSSMALSYVRSVNSGSGVTFGAENDTVSLIASRRFLRAIGTGAQINYSQNTGLQQLPGTQLNTQSLVASGQVSRAFSRVLSAYASYSWQHQSYSGDALGVTPFNGVSQTLGFGLTYSPPATHFRNSN
jgi:hypothetical protein